MIKGNYSPSFDLISSPIVGIILNILIAANGIVEIICCFVNLYFVNKPCIFLK
jgi:hypothetical protein